MRKKVSRMPRRPGMIGDMRFRGRMPRRGGFGFGLGEAIRRLKEQRDMGMPRMPSMDFGDQIGYKRPNKNPDAIAFDNPSFRMIGTPQPIPRAEIDISALERLPMGEMPMTQDLPEVAPVGMMPQMRMDDMQDMEPRMMMQEGEDVSVERELFSLQSQLENLQEQLRLDRSYNDDQAVINTSAEMAAIQRRMQEILNEGGRTISNQARRAIEAGKGSAVLDIEGRPQLKDGGEPFPDLSGDGQITRKDILMGQGVKFKAEGGEMMMEETEMMAPGGDDIEASLMEVQGMQPEMQQLDQFVQMVIEMIQAGASEAEVIESLRQAGLDDDDIAAVFQAVMATMQDGMEQGGIDQELAQLS